MRNVLEAEIFKIDLGTGEHNAAHCEMFIILCTLVSRDNKTAPWADRYKCCFSHSIRNADLGASACISGRLASDKWIFPVAGKHANEQ